jgi:hypothetical protein
MYTNAVADGVMLCLQHDFYNIIFKIKHKLCTESGSAAAVKILGAHLTVNTCTAARYDPWSRCGGTALGTVDCRG